MKSITAPKLARVLRTDDESRADEVPVELDGEKAYDQWIQAASDAGDSDTLTDLMLVDRLEFAVAWEAFAP